MARTVLDRVPLREAGPNSEPRTAKVEMAAMIAIPRSPTGSSQRRFLGVCPSGCVMVHMVPDPTGQGSFAARSTLSAQ